MYGFNLYGAIASFRPVITPFINTASEQLQSSQPQARMVLLSCRRYKTRDHALLLAESCQEHAAVLTWHIFAKISTTSTEIKVMIERMRCVDLPMWRCVSFKHL
jgi:hypothetical protein